MIETIKVSLVSLGCPKNLVDSEVLLGGASERGLVVTAEPEDADVAVVNTCGFIEAARLESLAAIREVARLRQSGRLKGLVVVGCMAERFAARIRAEVPAVDAILGLSDYAGVPDLLRALAGGREASPRVRGGAPKGPDSDRTRLLLTPRSYAYLRIAEGCDRSCSFCAIPLIRGRQRSKPIETLVAEAEALAQAGVRELVLVAEDSTAYGLDLEGRRLLAPLLRELAGVGGLAWIRILYAYPDTIREDLVAEIRENPKVVPYLDMPVQHASAKILRAMKRGVSADRLRALMARLRADVPGLVLRTTFLVGFPGETDEDFEELVDFIEEQRFERFGVFPFSPEEGTSAAALPDRVPEEVARARCDRVLELGRRLIEERNESLVGNVLRVLVDGQACEVPPGTGFERPGSVARSEADAPEIDCCIHLPGRYAPGTLLDVEVTASLGYDLVARPLGGPPGGGEARA